MNMLSFHRYYLRRAFNYGHKQASEDSSFGNTQELWLLESYIEVDKTRQLMAKTNELQASRRESSFLRDQGRVYSLK
jgi:hypothetical protein